MGEYIGGSYGYRKEKGREYEQGFKIGTINTKEETKEKQDYYP